MKILNQDSRFMSIFGRIVDHILLFAITILFCIPVVTAGASFTAMYYVGMKMARDEEPYVWKDFLKAFKQNFRQATILWIIMAAIIALLGVEIYLNKTVFSTNKVLPVIIWALVILLSLFSVYIFPVLARFELSIKHIIKNSMLLSIGNLFKSIIVVVISAAPFLGVYLFASYAAWITLIGFPVVIFVNSYIFTGIFKKIEPAEEEEESELDAEVPTEDDSNSTKPE